MLTGYTSPSPLTLFVLIGVIICLIVTAWILRSTSRLFYATTWEWLGELEYNPQLWVTAEDLFWLDEQFKWDHYMMTGYMPHRRKEGSYVYPLEQQEAMIECVKELIEKKIKDGVWLYE